MGAGAVEGADGPAPGNLEPALETGERGGDKHRVRHVTGQGAHRIVLRPQICRGPTLWCQHLPLMPALAKQICAVLHYPTNKEVLGIQGGNLGSDDSSSGSLTESIQKQLPNWGRGLG